jgi:hypothetical protein
MWEPPKETDPVLLHAPTRKPVALFGAVNLRTGHLVTQLCPTFDAVTFGAFSACCWGIAALSGGSS